MAYYIMNAGGLSFANADLMTDYTGMTVEKLMQERGREASLFGIPVFKLSDHEMADIFLHFDLVTIQNIDQAVSLFEKSETPLKDTKVIKADIRESYLYNGITFVPFKSLRVSSKYNFKKYFPAVKVCGSLFVALNAKFKDGRTSFYVKPSKTSK